MDEELDVHGALHADDEPPSHDQTLVWLQAGTRTRAPWWRRSGTPWLAAAAVIIFIGTVALIAIPTSNNHASAPRESTPTPSISSSSEAIASGPFASQAVTVGRPVTALGLGGIGKRADGTFELCSRGVYALRSDGTAARTPSDCQTIGARSLATLVPAAGVTLTTNDRAVAVKGNYLGAETIAVTRIDTRTSPQPDDPLLSTPCPTPPGGWPIRTTDLGPIMNYVRVHADAMLGGRVSQPRGSDEQVFTVGTTGDPVAVQKTLSAMYSGPLCVYPVPHSHSQLDEGASRAADVLRSNGITVHSSDRSESRPNFSVDYATSTEVIFVDALSSKAADELAPFTEFITLEVAIKNA